MLLEQDKQCLLCRGACRGLLVFSFVYPGDIITKDVVQKYWEWGRLYFTCMMNLYSGSLLINQSFSQKDVLRPCGGGNSMDRKKKKLANHCFRGVEYLEWKSAILSLSELLEDRCSKSVKGSWCTLVNNQLIFRSWSIFLNFFLHIVIRPAHGQ